MYAVELICNQSNYMAYAQIFLLQRNHQIPLHVRKRTCQIKFSLDGEQRSVMLRGRIVKISPLRQLSSQQVSRTNSPSPIKIIPSPYAYVACVLFNILQRNIRRISTQSRYHEKRTNGSSKSQRSCQTKFLSNKLPFHSPPVGSFRVKPFNFTRLSPTKTYSTMTWTYFSLRCPQRNYQHIRYTIERPSAGPLLPTLISNAAKYLEIPIWRLAPSLLRRITPHSHWPRPRHWYRYQSLNHSSTFVSIRKSQPLPQNAHLEELSVVLTRTCLHSCAYIFSFFSRNAAWWWYLLSLMRLYDKEQVMIRSKNVNDIETSYTKVTTLTIIFGGRTTSKVVSSLGTTIWDSIYFVWYILQGCLLFWSGVVYIPGHT